MGRASTHARTRDTASPTPARPRPPPTAFAPGPTICLQVFRNPVATFTLLVRSFSAGVILALALVHIVPEAVVEMVGLNGIEYPLGGVCVLFGVVLMVIMEHVAHIMHDTHLAHGHHTRDAELAVVAPADACDAKHHSDGGKHHSDAVAPVDGDGLAPSPGPGEDHSHVCVSRGSASNWVAAGTAEAGASLRLRIVAYMFELGCIFHSFIIGLTLGVNQTDLGEVRALLIALSFHQWLEAVSLASVVNRGGFERWKGVLMILTYSLTCPVGIAIGIAIAETYDAESTTARAVQGAFNGVSGGMLLYISLVQLVAEDMSRFTPGRASASIRLLCSTALFAGAAAMCLLAVWA